MPKPEGHVPFSFGHEPGERPAPPRARRPRRRGWLRALVLLAVLAGAVAAVWHFRPSVLRGVLRDTPIAPSPSVTRAYKWRDAQGSWHISDQPPPAGTPYQSIQVRSDENVLPPPKQEQ